MGKLIKISILVCLCLLMGIFSSAQADESLNWEDCLKAAAKNNPDLISAQENVIQQKAARRITASSLYPQLEADLSASTSGSSSTDKVTEKTTSSTADSYSYGLSATQLIFDGFKTLNNVKGSLEDIKSAQQGYRFTSSQIRLNLRTAFINLLKSQELIRVTGDIVKIRRDELELITLRYQSGLEHKGALLTSEANLAQASFELAQAKRDVVIFQRQLLKSMGSSDFKPISVEGDFTVSDTAKEKPDLETLAKTHSSVLQAAAKTNSALFGIKSTYGNFAPQLSGSAGAQKRSPFWPPNNNQWNLGLSLSMPIFEGGLRLAQLSQSEAAYRQAEADQRSTRDSVVAALEQDWAALQDALETVEVQYKSLIADEERARIAEAQYSVGFITYDNWTIIQDNLVRAKTSYLNARANALLAEASWIQAKGETLEYAQK
jgi:outer membrane protein TolC